MFEGLLVDTWATQLEITHDMSSVEFNIAATPGEDGPDVLSELVFDPIESSRAVVSAGYLWSVGKLWGLGVSGEYSTSWYLEGEAHDYDFSADGRMEEFSRSKAQLSGNDLSTIDLQLIAKARVLEVGHYIVFGLGISQIAYNLNMVKGVQIVPEKYEIEGLDSHYKPTFRGQYAFVALENEIGPVFLAIEYQHHEINFDAEAEWNLREDFAQPVSFSQDGTGTGYVAKATLTWPMSSYLDSYIKAYKWNKEVRNGYDQVYFSDGSSYITTLNSASSSGLSVSMGLHLRF